MIRALVRTPAFLALLVLAPAFDQKARVRPAPVAVDDPKFSGQVRVRFDKQGLE